MLIERLITLLEVIAVAGRPVTAAEAQRASGLPRPTCYRLLQTMAEHGLLAPEGEGARYVIGDRLLRIAMLGRSDADINRACAPTLKSAATRLGDCVFLSRLRDGAVEIIHVETPDDPSRPYIHPGLGRRPLHACSCAKAITAFAEPDFQDWLLAGGLDSYTEHTKTAPDEIRAELAEIRRTGYAVCHQEIEVGVVSVAAPVRLGRFGVPFSVGAVGPVRRYTARHCHQLGTRLAELAETLSGAI